MYRLAFELLQAIAEKTPSAVAQAVYDTGSNTYSVRDLLLFMEGSGGLVSDVSEFVRLPATDEP